MCIIYYDITNIVIIINSKLFLYYDNQKPIPLKQKIRISLTKTIITEDLALISVPLSLNYKINHLKFLKID